MITHTTALTVVHVMIVAWSRMMVAYAGHLNGKSPLNTNKRREAMMDSMTLASKEEVRKVIIELISIANLTTKRDDVIIANARLTLQKLSV